MSTTLAEKPSAVKKPAKKRTSKKAATTTPVEAATSLVQKEQEVVKGANLEAAVRSVVVELPTMTPSSEVSAPEVPAGQTVVDSAASDYSGNLPVYNGQPIFIEREHGAWAFYLNPQAFGFRHERIRNYLMIQDAFAVAEAMGRPLTIDDLKLLVGPDEDEFLCSATKKMFRPMWWVLVTKDLLAQLREGKTLAELDSEEKLNIVGHFFFRNGQVLAYSGTPYRWRNGDKEDSIAWHSPVTIAYKANGHRWPMVRGHAEHLKESRQEKRENLVHMGEEIAKQIGSDWRPSDNNGRNNGNRRRDNRH